MDEQTFRHGSTAGLNAAPAGINEQGRAYNPDLVGAEANHKRAMAHADNRYVGERVNQGILPGMPPAPIMSEIEQELTEMRDLLERAESAIELLASRLSPVLGPEMSEKGSGTVAPSRRSTIAQVLQNNNARIQRGLDNLHYLCARVEL